MLDGYDNREVPEAATTRTGKRSFGGFTACSSTQLVAVVAGSYGVIPHPPQRVERITEAYSVDRRHGTFQESA